MVRVNGLITFNVRVILYLACTNIVYMESLPLCRTSISTRPNLTSNRCEVVTVHW